MVPAIRRPQEKVGPAVRHLQAIVSHMAIVAQRTESPTEQGGGGQRSRIYTKEKVTSGRTQTDRLTGEAQDAVLVGGGKDIFVRP